jgi:hypothetical protein|tara:strand:- start:688 stop:915 length:228 start_codon:yes stop_codon:yes gene_type:complete
MDKLMLLRSCSIIVFSSILLACDGSPSQEPQDVDPFSSNGLPTSQRQQEDSAAGVKFGGKQGFKPLAPPATKYKQ